jgi:excisionase family DNA binding protein
MFGVSITTVVRWIEAGLVVAYRTPGGHRRITRDQLHQFARQRGLGFLIGDGDAED